MRIIDRLKSLWTRKTPRIIKVEPGRLTIKARGCHIVINENRLDKRGRELTEIIVAATPVTFKWDSSHPIGVDIASEYQLIAAPDDQVKSRSGAAIHVVKLKAPRKPKRAKPGQDDAPQEPYTGAKIDKGAS